MIQEGMPYRKVRPMPHEKEERNRMLFDTHILRPDLTYEDLGKIFGISKQRVHELIKRAKDGKHG